MKWYYSPDLKHREYITGCEEDLIAYVIINNDEAEELIIQDYRNKNKKFYLNDNVPATSDHFKYIIKLLFYYGKARKT